MYKMEYLLHGNFTAVLANLSASFLAFFFFPWYDSFALGTLPLIEHLISMVNPHLWCKGFASQDHDYHIGVGLNWV